MKTQDSKYRFTLQWSADTAENILVGDLLEQLKNRKSDFVIQAIMAYLNQEQKPPTLKVIDETADMDPGIDEMLNNLDFF